MTFRFPVESGAILMFARSLGDLDPRWYDEDSEEARAHGGVAAPPTFVASVAHFDPDWPYRPRAEAEWFGSGAGPGSPSPTVPGGGTSMQAEQHYEYYAPLRPGDVLTVERSAGRTWEKESKRSGTLLFEEEITRYTNQDGKLAVVATRVRVITGRTAGP